MKNHFDLVVIGAGSGGLAAAKRAASYGAHVAIVEGDQVGGTCVIRGCVPKKLLVYGSLFNEQLARANDFGIQLNKSKIDKSLLLTNVRNEVSRLNVLHIEMLRKSGVELISGWASFVDQNTIRVNNKEKNSIREIKGTRILVAVGGRPTRPDIPGAELGWVSDDIFVQKELPQRIVIVGGGFISCEFACIFNGLGIQVTQLVRREHLLNGFDTEITFALQQEMLEKNILFHFGTSPISIEGNPGQLHVITQSGSRIACDGLLFATGRKPFLKGLNLNAAGINSENGKIHVDKNQQTNISSIYAVGDVTDKINLTPVAIDEGRAFADRIYGKKNREVDYNFVPSAVFSQPEIAMVGLTEDKAIQIYGKDKVVSYRSSFRPMSQALSKGKSRCVLKLVVEEKTDKIVGCHMFGEHASEIIQMSAVAILMGATKSDFDRTMALHPTIAEEFVTMR